MPGAGGTLRLVHAIGKAKAMKMILTGVPVGGAQAVADGIAAESAPDAECLDRAIALAEAMAKNGPLAIRLAKDSAKRAFDMPLPQAIEHERSNFFAAMHKTTATKAWPRSTTSASPRSWASRGRPPATTGRPGPHRFRREHSVADSAVVRHREISERTPCAIRKVSHATSHPPERQPR